MSSIHTFWSANNMIAERKLQDAVTVSIQQKWKTQRYRRFVYYFFEKEIISDTKSELRSNFMATHHLLFDPEYQACVARSSLGQSIQGGVVWSDLTFLINNYIFRQDVFVVSDAESDVLLHEQILALLQQGNNPGFLDDSLHRMSDLLFRVRAVRSHRDLVQAISTGEHTYHSLLKACGEYIGQYAQLPFFFSVLGLSRSAESLNSVLESSSHDALAPLLEPSYEIVCHALDPDLLKAYGYVSILKTPYATWLGILGYRRSRTPWYIKVALSIVIVSLSGLLGGVALVILPIVWGILAMARSSSQYLQLLHGFLADWYTQYSLYSTKYLSLYDKMLDTDDSSSELSTAQQTMNRRYDVVPFSGHELVGDATQYAKTLYDAIIGSISKGTAPYVKDVARVSSVAQRSKDNNLSLIVVQDGQYTEQVSYRFDSLLFLVKTLISDLEQDSDYKENYEILDDVIDTKKYKFWYWSFRSSLLDGLMVGLTSGVLGWLGSYLRNRGVTGSSAFAATPGITAHTLTQSDPQFFLDSALLEKMHAVMKPEDVDVFVNSLLVEKHSDTLWDTMVDLFGHQQGNIYTNELMDARWRVTDVNGHSTLFSAAISHDMPAVSADIGWAKMINFLHRVYGYDSLQQYETLIDKPWLSETLQGLKDGSFTLTQFDQLDIEQREIVTQAMFYMVPKEDVSGLFVGSSDRLMVDAVQSGVIDQRLANLLGFMKLSSSLDGASTGSALSSGTVDGFSVWDRVSDFFDWTSSSLGDMFTADVPVSLGTFTSPFTGWGEFLSSGWDNLFHSNYTITETVSSDLSGSGIAVDLNEIQSGQFDQRLVDLLGLTKLSPVADTVLSGAEPQATTGLDVLSSLDSSPLHISQFTVPLMKKDKQMDEVM